MIVLTDLSISTEYSHKAFSFTVCIHPLRTTIFLQFQPHSSHSCLIRSCSRNSQAGLKKTRTPPKKKKKKKEPQSPWEACFTPLLQLQMPHAQTKKKNLCRTLLFFLFQMETRASRTDSAGRSEMQHSVFPLDQDLGNTSQAEHESQEEEET